MQPHRASPQDQKAEIRQHRLREQGRSVGLWVLRTNRAEETIIEGH